MKHALFLLCLLVSAPTFANNAATKAAAPSSDHSATNEKNGQQVYHDYDNTDTIQTGQSATRRDARPIDICKLSADKWLYKGDAGYASCMRAQKAK